MILFSRAIWLNFPGMAAIITLSCLVGVVMYAFYADCDPVKFGLIDKPDQVEWRTFLINTQSFLKLSSNSIEKKKNHYKKKKNLMKPSKV